MKSQKHPPPPEFSRPLALEGLHDGENVVEIAADDAERAALAKRFGLLALPSLSARYSVWPEGGRSGVRTSGRLAAEVVQACVVTLGPVRSRIEADFERVFAPMREAGGGRAETFVEPEGEDPPDPVVAGMVDLGECAAEQLALEIDPFPRAPGVEFRGFSSDMSESRGEAEGPFAALAKLKGKL